MSQRLRILVVDDQTRARQSVKALLDTWPQTEEVRQAATGRQAILLVEETQPDVVLMDARMPEMDGLEATRRIKAAWPWVKVVVLSMYPEYAGEAMAAGADAFMGKGEPPDRLLSVLSAIIL